MTSLFEDREKNSRVETLAALTNRELHRRWQSIGVRLFDELPNDFQRAFAACLGMFAEAPIEAREPSLDNWDRIGAELVAAGSKPRRTMCGLIVECSDAVAEAGAPARSSLTFGRIARLAEVVVQEATEFISEEADADEFFIELEDDDAQELDSLVRDHKELVVIAFAMSLKEWATSHPQVQLVQVRFGDRNMDVRVGRGN